MIVEESIRANSVKEYYFAQKLKEIAEMRKKGSDVINLGIGNPDLPPPQSVTDKLISEVKIESNHGYQSYTGTDELRKAFSVWYKKYFKVKIDYKTEILPLIGSKEGIMHISLAFINPGDEVLIPNPSYPTYSAVSNIVGAKVIEYDLKHKNKWLPDLDELSKRDLSKVKLMWINYPNMPTGKSASVEFYNKLIEFANQYKILICNDNPYSFILNKKYLSLLSIPGAKKVAIELNSLSKSMNMAGWRIGAVFGKSEYIKTILKIKSNMDSGKFYPMQSAAEVALYNDEKWYKNINQVYKERRKIARKILDKLNCKYEKKTVGMFVWAKIDKTFKDSIKFSDYYLKTCNVFFTPGAIFGTNGNQYIRISLCSNEEKLNETFNRISYNILRQKSK